MNEIAEVLKELGIASFSVLVVLALVVGSVGFTYDLVKSHGFPFLDFSVMFIGIVLAGTVIITKTKLRRQLLREFSVAFFMFVGIPIAAITPPPWNAVVLLVPYQGTMFWLIVWRNRIGIHQWVKRNIQ